MKAARYRSCRILPVFQYLLVSDCAFTFRSFPFFRFLSFAQQMYLALNSQFANEMLYGIGQEPTDTFIADDFHLFLEKLVHKCKY